MIAHRITGALAWAGLVIVVAVPTADLVLARLAPQTAASVEPVADTVSPVQDPVPPAAAETTGETAQAPAANPAPKTPNVRQAAVQVAQSEVPASSDNSTGAAADGSDGGTAGVSDDPVGDYLASHGSLPSYLTPSAGPPRATAAAAPTDAEPAAPAAAEPATPAPAAALAQAPQPPAAAPAAPGAASAQPVVPPAATTIAAAAPVPMPASARPKASPAATATEADLKDWKSGSLEDYLRQRGLLSQSAAPSGN